MNTSCFGYLRFALAISVLLVSQYVTAQVEQPDTTRVDSSHAAHEDTLASPVIPISLIGSVDRTIAPEQTLPDSSKEFVDYKNASDVLLLRQGVFVQDLGSPGQLHGLTIQGLDARSIGFMNDGISLNDPFTGVYNFNLYPTENFERIEFIQGTRAFLYGLNSTGGGINFVSKTRKAIHPFTRIRYGEAVFGNGFFDGMFSQNITRAFNLSVGVQHVTYDGRFPNSDNDAWNLRIKLRYNINNRLNFFASEIYNKTQLGLNGGIDTSTQLALRFERLQATMRNTDSYEKITRHDIQFGAAAELFPDTTAVTTITFYHSSNLREYRDESNRPNPNQYYVFQDDRSQWYGIKLLQHFETRNDKLEVGGEIQSRGVIASSVTTQHLETQKNLFGKNELYLNDALNVSFYGRYDNYLARSRFSYGGDASLSPTSWVKFFGGYSRSYRFPTVEELYWNDTYKVVASDSNLLPEAHHLFETGIRLTGEDETFLELKYFHRVINDAIVIVPTMLQYPLPTLKFVQKNQLTIQGVEASAQVRLGKIFVDGNLQFVEFKDNNGYQLTLPKWSAMGGMYYWSKLVHDYLNLKVGVRGRVFTAYQGSEFNPHALMYVPSTQSQIGLTAVGDFVLQAHIGDAHVHLIWENLADLQYVITPFYPMPERSVRFGISWEFTN